MKPTLFFYGNPIDDTTRHRRRVTTDSPAGSRKMLAISRALREEGVRVVLVSMGRGRADGSGNYHRAHVGRWGGTPVLYGPMYHRRGWSELISMAWLAWVALRMGHRVPAARHLFYNQFTAYLPALLWLRMTGRATLCDIEDGPVSAGQRAGARSRGDAPPRLFSRLISHGALLACTALQAGTRIRPTIPCYGAVSPVAIRSGRTDAGEVVVMTGMFDAATGVELLEAGFAAIAADRESFRHLRFEFSGFGPRFLPLQAEAERWGIDAVFHGRLDAADYDALLRRATVGLSLKAIGGPYAQSTFPSKVVEYAQHGLCVIATDISDVRRVLGDTALYMEADDPALLIAHLRRIGAEPSIAGTIGRSAQARVEDELSYRKVGAALRDFMFGRRAA